MTTTVTAKAKDEILEMFFDEEFVPQAFVDILLTNKATEDLQSLQTISTNFLTKLDFYTRNLTIELENTIFNLEKLSETLPGTYSKYNNDKLNHDNNINNHNSDILNASNLLNDLSINSTEKNNTNSINLKNQKIMGISKLEYYIDTLGSSVKSLESDLNNVEKDINNLKNNNNNYNNNSNKTATNDNSEKILTKLNNLKIIKQRLNNVLNIFKELQKIMIISNDSSTDNNNDDDNDANNNNNNNKGTTNDTDFDDHNNIQNSNDNSQININDFDISLQTLQDIIEQSLEILINSYNKSSNTTTNDNTTDTTTIADTNNIDKTNIMLNETEIFDKIDQFTKLLPVFNNLKPFDESFNIFIENIHEMKDDYLFEIKNGTKNNNNKNDNDKTNNNNNSIRNKNIKPNTE